MVETMVAIMNIRKSAGALLALCAANAFAADVVDLSGTWRLSLATNAAETCAVEVPGDVHTALFAAGRIPDPYRGCNETNVQWVAKEDWAFARSFDVAPEFLAKKRVVLEIEDADTFADVYLNGVKVGETSNRFARWTFDAKKALKPGRNEIRAVFRSAWNEADRRRAEIGRAFPMSNVPWAKNQALIRKPACHAGWDWGLAQMTTGFKGGERRSFGWDMGAEYRPDGWSLATVRHGGYTGVTVAVDPENGYAGVVLTNRTGDRVKGYHGHQRLLSLMTAG